MPYKSEQPRVPAGSPNGGQWTAGAAIGRALGEGYAGAFRQKRGLKPGDMDLTYDKSAQRLFHEPHRR